MSSRLCPLCLIEHIPTYRAMCRFCFDMVPWKNRAELLHRWRRRIIDPAGYQEELAETRKWYINSRNRRERAEDIESEE